MNKNKTQKQTAAEWLERRKNLKEQINEIKLKIQKEFPGEAILKRPADDARDRLNDFFNANKKKDGKVPDNKIAQLEALKADFDDKLAEANNRYKTAQRIE